MNTKINTEQEYENAKSEAEKAHDKVTFYMTNGTRKQLRAAQEARRIAEQKRDNLYARFTEERA